MQAGMAHHVQPCSPCCGPCWQTVEGKGLKTHIKAVTALFSQLFHTPPPPPTH